MPTVRPGLNTYPQPRDSFEETARRVLDFEGFRGVDLPKEEIIARMRESISEEERKRIENAGNPELEIFKIVAFTILDMYEEKLKRLEEKYRKFLADFGAPRSRLIEKKIKLAREEFNKVKQAVSSLDSSQSNTKRVTYKVSGTRLLVHRVKELIRDLYELRDIVAKLGRGEGITWREARELVNLYDIREISHLVYPKKIKVPPVKLLEKYAKMFEKLYIEPSGDIEIYRRAIEVSANNLRVRIELDREVELPEDVEALNVDLHGLRVEALYEIAKHGLEISVTSEGFKASIGGKAVNLDLFLDIFFHEDPLAGIEAELARGSYGVLEYTRETGRVFQTYSESGVTLATTGDLVIDCIIESCYVLPARVIGMKPLEVKTNDGKLSLLDIGWEETSLLSLMMAESRGRLLVGSTKDYGVVKIDFKDKGGVGVTAYYFIYDLEYARRYESWRIDEVNIVKVKPAPYLGEFIKAYTSPGSRRQALPLLVTHDGILLIINQDGYIYMAPASTVISKPVRVDTRFYNSMLNLIDLGIVPVDPVKDKKAGERVARAIEAYEIIKQSAPVEYYEVKKPSSQEGMEGLPSYVVKLARTVYGDLGYKGRLKVNVYEHEEEGVAVRVVEGVIGRGTRVVKSFLKYY